MVTTNEPNIYETGVLDSNAEGNFVYTTLDAAIMCAMNLADNFFKEQEKSEHLRQQVKQYLDEANQMKQELSEAKREIFRLQQGGK